MYLGKVGENNHFSFALSEGLCNDRSADIIFQQIDKSINSCLAIHCLPFDYEVVGWGDSLIIFSELFLGPILLVGALKKPFNFINQCVPVIGLSLLKTGLCKDSL